MFHSFKNYVTLLLGLFLFYSTAAQEVNVDSLEQLINSNVEDETKFEALVTLSNNFNRSDTDKSIEYANQLLKLSEQKSNYYYASVAYDVLAKAYRQKDYGLDTVLNAADKSIEMAQKADDKTLEANALNSKALTYVQSGQMEKAFSLYQQAFEILDAIGNKKKAVRSLGNMAILIRQSGNLESAKNYYDKAIRYASEVGDEIMVSQLGNNLGNILLDENKIDSALTLYEKSVEINRAAGNKYFLSIGLTNIAKVYMQKGLHEIAYPYLNEGYEVAKEMEDTYTQGLALSVLCEYHYEKKEYSKTIKIAKEALSILGENGDVLTRSYFYNWLSVSYKEQNNYKLAFENKELFTTFSDSIYSIEKAKEINSLKLKYEVNQKEIENELLKAEKTIAEKTIRNRTFIAVGLILALLFALGWGGLVYRANQEKKKLNEVLEAKVEERTIELQNANNNLEQANYELRTFNFIASHDIKEPIRNIGSYAGLIFRKLPQELKTQFEPSFDTIKRSTQQLYTLIEDFANYTRMSKNDTVELQSVDLNEIVNGIEAAMYPAFQEHKGQIINHGLPHIQTSNSLIYTVLKNLIENGLKFNESPQPTVHINYEKTATHHQITVTDNGIGIEPAYHETIFEMFKRLHNRTQYKGSGIGLAIVKLVSEKLGMSIQVKSELDKGSTFSLMIPIDGIDG